AGAAVAGAAAGALVDWAAAAGLVASAGFVSAGLLAGAAGAQACSNWRAPAPRPNRVARRSRVRRERRVVGVADGRGQVGGMGGSFAQNDRVAAIIYRTTQVRGWVL